MKEKWDYAEMERCAGNLRELEEKTQKNKELIMSAIDELLGYNDTEISREFKRAVESKIAYMDKFAEILVDEAEQLDKCRTHMEITEEELAKDIRRIFSF